MHLFGKKPPPDPRKKVQEVSRALRKEGRVLDRQLNNIKKEELKVKHSLKAAASKGDKTTCAILAKEIVHTKKAVNRIYAAKAQISSVEMSVKNQAAMVRVSGAFEKSTDVMKAMQSLVKVSEVRDSMMELSKEMMKMGIIEETMDEAFPAFDEGEEMEEAAQDEIDKVLYEITAGALGKIPDSEVGELPHVEVPEEEVETEDDDVMQQRLEALRS
ncbi:charged multivesicular body protein 3-like [Clavelina lepadiformis]|uniref:charged multivesicular body protein 3-like n=1 Tax=Clavelina lepadiformis TaxID=159417 RepID=UPI004043896C